jgi:uncharacterized protein
MKNKIFLVLFMLCANVVPAQSQSYNVVFDLTSGDSADHQSLIRWIKGISSSNPGAKLEVVFYGQSLNMITKGKSAVESDIKEILAQKNVDFKVCALAMKRHHVDKSELIDGVGIVPDGIFEIITKEREGWGYIKAAR